MNRFLSCRMKRFINTRISKLLSNCVECSVHLPKSVGELWIELRTTSGQNDFYCFFVGNASFV